MTTLTRRTLPTVLAALSARAIVSDSEPVNPNIGAIWFDTTTGALKVWDGSAWNIAEINTAGLADGSVDVTKISFTLGDIGGAKVTISASAPGSPAIGDVWFDAANGYEMKSWNGSSWVAFQWDSGALAPGSVDVTKVSFTARDIDGIATTFAAVAPGSPKTGDLWYDSSNDYKLNRYDGAAWVAVQYGTDALAAGSITAALIAANTITAAQIAAGTITATELAANSVTATAIQAGAVSASKLAAGIVYAGIVDATTITGAQFVATGTAGEILAYDGAPASGNMILSVSAHPGSDAFGNSYPRGILIQDPAGATFLSINHPNASSDAVIGCTTAGGSGPRGSGPQLLIEGPGISGNAPAIMLRTDDGVQAEYIVLDADNIQIGDAPEGQDYSVQIGNGPAGKYYSGHYTFSRTVATGGSGTALNGFATTVQEKSDYTSPWSAGTFTAPAAGFYSFGFLVDSIGTATTRGELYIKKNGTTIAANARDNLPAQACSTAAPAVWLAAGDTVTFVIFQNTGGNVTYTGSVTARREL